MLEASLMLHTDADFVAWPERDEAPLIYYWLGVAFYFDYCGGLVGGFEREAG